MGGFCGRRAGCPHYQAEDRSDPAERLCASGRDGERREAFAEPDIAPPEPPALRTHQRWTDEEDTYLRANYLTMPTWQLKQTLSRFTSKQIWERACRLKLGAKRVNHTPGGNFGAPPAKRQALIAMLEAAGAHGISAADLVAANPGVTDNALKVRVLMARADGLCYSLRERYAMRHFAASVPREDAEATMVEFDRRAAERLARAKAKKKQDRAAEVARNREKRKAATIAAEARLAQAKQAAREAQTLARAQEKERARVEARKQATIKRTAEATKVKVQRGTAVAAVSKQIGPARLPGDLDLSRAKITRASAPVDRFAVEIPAYGGFSGLPPGQYAFEPASCAAKAAA